MSAMMTNTPFAEGDTAHGTRLGWNAFTEMEVAGAMAIQLAYVVDVRDDKVIGPEDIDSVNTMVLAANHARAAASLPPRTLGMGGSPGDSPGGSTGAGQSPLSGLALQF